MVFALDFVARALLGEVEDILTKAKEAASPSLRREMRRCVAATASTGFQRPSDG